MAHEYADFRNGVRDQLKNRFRAWEVSEEELEKFVDLNEGQVMDAYNAYLNPKPIDKRDDEARFKSGISAVSMCLEYSY